jgi:putative endonuclease
MPLAGPPWHVYIVRCADGTLYTGVAIDVAKRVAQHNGTHGNTARVRRNTGARYTRARRPVKLVYQERAANRSAACRREYRIKQLTRREKLALIASGSRIISAGNRNRE